MELSRRDTILKLIVEYYINNAQPVGSQTLIQEYGLEYSSATIRNEMQSLEELGYLEKTHTSSGRVPSSEGYKYYIEHLRHKDLDEEIKYSLQTILQEKNKSIEDVLKESCEILAHMTQLASVVLGPESDSESLVSIQIIPLSENSATAVFVTDKGYVENRTFVLGDSVNMQDVQKCIELLNNRLKGTAISKLPEKMESIKPLLSDYVKQHDIIYQAILQTFLKLASDRINTYGRSSLFEQPEYSKDADKLKKMMALLDNPECLRSIIADGSAGDVEIKIGNVTDELTDASVIRAKLSVPGHDLGTIALVGPKRMDYDKVVSALEYIAEQLDKYFKEEKGDDSEDVRKE